MFFSSSILTFQLQKASKDVWKKRWIVLGSMDPHLKVYKTIKSINPEEIKFTAKSNVKKSDTELSFTITETSRGDLVMKTQTETEQLEWILVCEEVIHSLIETTK